MGKHIIYPKAAGIYKLTCDNNGKIYIGKSINIRKRLESHKNCKNISALVIILEMLL